MQEYIHCYIRYNFSRGPGNELERGEILEMNCQGWVHKALRERFGIQLPPWYLSQEIYEDEKTFVTTVSDISIILPGAIFLFGPHNLIDTRRLHLALYSGYRTIDTNEPILEHVNIVDKTVGVWPLKQFSQEQRYKELYAIKQPVKRVQ